MGDVVHLQHPDSRYSDGHGICHASGAPSMRWTRDPDQFDCPSCERYWRRHSSRPVGDAAQINAELLAPAGLAGDVFDFPDGSGWGFEIWDPATLTMVSIDKYLPDRATAEKALRQAAS